MFQKIRYDCFKCPEGYYKYSSGPECCRYCGEKMIREKTKSHCEYIDVHKNLEDLVCNKHSKIFPGDMPFQDIIDWCRNTKKCDEGLKADKD